MRAGEEAARREALEAKEREEELVERLVRSNERLEAALGVINEQEGKRGRKQRQMGVESNGPPTEAQLADEAALADAAAIAKRLINEQKGMVEEPRDVNEDREAAAKALEEAAARAEEEAAAAQAEAEAAAAEMVVEDAEAKAKRAWLERSKDTAKAAEAATVKPEEEEEEAAEVVVEESAGGSFAEYMAKRNAAPAVQAAPVEEVAAPTAEVPTAKEEPSESGGNQQVCGRIKRSTCALLPPPKRIVRRCAAYRC